MGLVPLDQLMLNPGKGKTPACTAQPAGSTRPVGPKGPGIPPPKKLPSLETDVVGGAGVTRGFGRGFVRGSICFLLEDPPPE